MSEEMQMQRGMLAVFLVLVCVLGIAIPWWRGNESEREIVAGVDPAASSGDEQDKV